MWKCQYGSKRMHFLCNLLLGEMILCIVITQPQRGYSKIRHKFWCPEKWRHWARHSVCVAVKMQCFHSGFLCGHIMSLFPCFIPDPGVHFFVLIYGWVVSGNTLKCRKKGSTGLLLGFLCSVPLETRICCSMWWNWDLYLTFPSLTCCMKLRRSIKQYFVVRYAQHLAHRHYKQAVSVSFEVAFLCLTCAGCLLGLSWLLQCSSLTCPQYFLTFFFISFHLLRKLIILSSITTSVV